MGPATHHLSISAVRAGALFVSSLQRSDTPSRGQVQQAIAEAIRVFGSRGCGERVAQEFGDHPEAALGRMRWALWAVGEAFGGSALRQARVRPPAQHAMAGARHAA